MKKKLFLDNYKNNIIDNKLEIVNFPISVNAPQESIDNQKKDNAKFITKEETKNEDNVYSELNCREKMPELKILKINNQNIIQVNSKIYSYLNNLKTLDFSHNVIGSISKKITNLQYLKIINLSDNFISYLPPFLKELKYLEELNLSNNKIELIPTSIQYFSNLKILNISQNNIEKLPMELGLIAKLENLSIEKNEFIELPNTLSYLDNLKSLTLEWFEFLDPELSKIQNDKLILQNLKNFMKNQLMNSIYTTDFHTFSIKMSLNIQKYMEENFNENENFDESKEKDFNFKLKDVFYALNNNYFGVIKSFINENVDLIRAKDLYSGKNLLYLAIQLENKKIANFLISKVDFTTVKNNSSILFRGIRSRNYDIFMKLVKLGFSLEVIDLKGNNVYHVLFSCFNKHYEQCTQIGNYLIENNVPGYNDKNYDGWAPIHMAAKYSSYVCFEWIGHINKILESQKRETFHINLLGKNKYTPFHLTCSLYKYSECRLLLNLGAELLLRGSDGKMPKNTTYNFFLTKMFFMKETELFYNKYIKNNFNKNNISNTKNINAKGIKTNKKILFTFDNYYDTKNENRMTYINSERSKSEILCFNEKYSLLEKYQILMTISLSNDKNEIIQIIKDIFKEVNFKYKQNYMIICEVLGLIQNYNLYEFYQELQKRKKEIDIKNIFLKREMDKVIIYLEKNKGKKLIKQKGRVLLDNNKYINKNKKALNLNKKRFENKLMSMTETDMNYYLLNSNELRKRNDKMKQKFAAPGFQKLKEKKVQESITSIDFEE